jgi:hypothetical protein
MTHTRRGRSRANWVRPAVEGQEGLHSMGRRLKDEEDRSIFNSTMALKTNGEQDEQGIGNLPESRKVEVVCEMSRRGS